MLFHRYNGGVRSTDGSAITDDKGSEREEERRGRI
jgi:hypothetical protein